MTDKITGVFVRLPLSEAQREQYLEAINSGEPLEAEASALEAGILAIGTPVTGGDMKNDMIKCFIPDYVLQDFSSDEPMDGIEEYIMRESCAGYTPLARQSDHQAQIAALDAEVVRLREENEHLHRVAYSGRGSVTQTIHSPTRFMESSTKGGAA